MKNYDIFLVACFFLIIPSTTLAFFSGDMGKGEDRLQEARTLFERGQDEAADTKIDEAVEYFNKVLAKSKINEADVARAHENMGYCHWLRHQDGLAHDNFKRAAGNDKARQRILKFLDDECNKSVAEKNFVRSFVINGYAIDLDPSLKTELVKGYMEAAKMWLSQENGDIAKVYIDEMIMMDSSKRKEAVRLLYEAGYQYCGANVAPGVWKGFDCYNLAAIGKATNDDPFIPSWRLNGGYWQWGRKGPESSQWYDTNTPNFAHGPTGPGENEANEGEISGWDSSYAPDGSWSDVHKTANDPCQAGFRVPTRSQWDGVMKNNMQRTLGSWSDSVTNYSSTRFFGDKLLLPATGYRYDYGGVLKNRGLEGSYWSSSVYGSQSAWRLRFTSGKTSTDNYSRRYGRSVRCVAE